MLRAASKAGFLILGLAMAAVGCGSSGGATTGTAGTTGSAGTTGAGTAGTNGGAGTTGSAGTTGAGGTSSQFPSCTVMTASLGTSYCTGNVTPGCMLDFANGTSAFGDFSGGFSGSTFAYSGSSSPAIMSDYSAGTWHMTGAVGDYSGFGISLPCAGSPDSTESGKANLSAYSGIQFDIVGTYTSGGDGGTAPTTGLTFYMGTPLDSVTATYSSTPTTKVWGTCVPTSGNQYDGSCQSPGRAVSFTSTKSTVMIPWTGLVGGKPSGSLDPTQVMSFSWVFPYTQGAAPYNVDLTIDNIQLY
jgi:hypothetical protein